MERSGSSKARCMMGDNGEAELKLCNAESKRAGWITFPFITGTVALLMMGGNGWMTNLIVYLIQEFDVNRIDAAQIYNVVNGCFCLLPILAAIIADSKLGCFVVASVSSFVASVGVVFLSLTATFNSLRPEPCGDKSSSCKAPSNLQLAVLYTGIVLATLGASGVRFTTATLGANQFESQKDQSTFFNWFFFAQYAGFVLSSTLIVYIEDSVSWALGFWLCVAANLVGLAVLVAGNRYYRHETPEGSPILSLARVLVASFRKWKLQLTLDGDEFYYGRHGQNKEVEVPPKKNFRFLNRAAVKTDGDTKPDNSIARPWRLCTVQQVEDLKAVIKVLPLWSSAIFLSTPIAVQNSMTVLQALTMDRHLGPHFMIPAGSVLVMVMISSLVSLALIDRCQSPSPLWKKLTGSPPTVFHRIGVGHLLNVLGMIASALIESRRLRTAHLHHLQNINNHSVPMSVLWLFPQLILVGIGEAFHFPGQVLLYFREFPANLSNSSTAMVSAMIGIAYYLSTVLVNLVRRSTGWLPENLNDGRLDCVYWLLAGVGLANFGYYLVCAKLYTGKDGNSSSNLPMTDVAGEKE
ncbi:protein NRT1/ PTR FAMILY 2.7-like [Rhodamnia argentea]|uniref:Protein NRT1/ PTR FAMILY 2.7-like n=1 Tax=Rhodamnia argentea TaxID=178133 RepID=A0A8B8NW71_9MYRT|nr:protein NRT1/ PTR FAMILY 2.7-like [Rhodamnia argentea]